MSVTRCISTYWICHARPASTRLACLTVRTGQSVGNGSVFSIERANPVVAQCNNTACQKFLTDTATSTISAAKATTGVEKCAKLSARYRRFRYCSESSHSRVFVVEILDRVKTRSICLRVKKEQRMRKSKIWRVCSCRILEGVFPNSVKGELRGELRGTLYCRIE